jgi:hypothetical protein
MEGFGVVVSVVVVEIGFTVWITAAEVLGLKLVLPAKLAVSEWAPGVTLEVARAAVPLVSVTVPRVVVPSLKVTLPVAVPVPGLTAATVAVRVNVWPDTEGFGAVASVVVVEAGFTTTVKGADELAANCASPA